MIIPRLALTILTLATNEPSFNCRYAKTTVEKQICSTPTLAALDRELAEVFNNTVHQGGIDAQTLRREETDWVTKLRDACSDVHCIYAAYMNRLQALRDQSLRAASPAVYEETRPFNVSVDAMARMQSRLGTSCVSQTPLPGFEPIPGFLPIIFDGFEAYPQRMGDDRFAFLLHIDDKAPNHCVVVDAVALPKPATANAFLSCSGPDVPSPGVGMRLSGQQALVAYWYVDAPSNKLERQPLTVLNAATSTRCHEPENGE